MLERGRLVRIPRTSARTARLIFAKLLFSVKLAAVHGFDFEGSFLKPGSEILEAELWPTELYPEIPVLLECAGMQHPQGSTRSRLGQALFILWRYDKAARIWSEVARSQSESWEWSLDLGPIATRAMKPKPPLDVSAIVARIGEILDQELAGLDAVDRVRAVCVLHDRLAGEMAK